MVEAQGRGGLSCSLTTWYTVHPTPCGVCNELAVGSVMGKKSGLFLLASSLFFVTTLRGSRQLGILQQALCVRLNVLPLSLPPAHSLSFLFLPPLLLHSIIYSCLCPGKDHPHIAGRERGLAQGVQEGNISTHSENLARDGGSALQWGTQTEEGASGLPTQLYFL